MIYDHIILYTVTHLAEEALGPAAGAAGVVDVDVVVLARDGLLHEGLADPHLPTEEMPVSDSCEPTAGTCQAPVEWSSARH